MKASFINVSFTPVDSLIRFRFSPPGTSCVRLTPPD